VLHQRQSTRCKSGCKITCLEHGLKLATLNISDFDWIVGLTSDALTGFAT